MHRGAVRPLASMAPRSRPSNAGSSSAGRGVLIKY
jgi:hypothetical protein